MTVKPLTKTYFPWGLLLGALLSSSFLHAHEGNVFDDEACSVYIVSESRPNLSRLGRRGDFSAAASAAIQAELIQREIQKDWLVYRATSTLRLLTRLIPLYTKFQDEFNRALEKAGGELTQRESIAYANRTAREKVLTELLPADADPTALSDQELNRILGDKSAITVTQFRRALHWLAMVYAVRYSDAMCYQSLHDHIAGSQPLEEAHEDQLLEASIGAAKLVESALEIQVRNPTHQPFFKFAGQLYLRSLSELEATHIEEGVQAQDFTKTASYFAEELTFHTRFVRQFRMENNIFAKLLIRVVTNE